MKRLLLSFILLTSTPIFAQGVEISKELLNQARVDVLQLGSELHLDNTANEIKLTHTHITKQGSSDVIMFKFEYDQQCKLMGYDIQLDSAVNFNGEECR